MALPLLIPLACVVLVLAVVRQLLLYPGHPRFAFGSEHRTARRALHKTRRRKRSLDANAKRGRSSVERRVKAIEKTGRQCVRALEKERDALLNPGWGDLVAELGPLQLYQHALLYFSETPEGEDASGGYDEISLAGLSADSKFGRENSFIKVSDRSGEILTARYPHYLYSEDDVQDFCDLINDASITDRDFRTGQRGQVSEINARIRQAMTDTEAAVGAARSDVDELTEAHRVNPQMIQANADWEAQCQAWQDLTGRRPVWWWRW